MLGVDVDFDSFRSLVDPHEPDAWNNEPNGFVACVNGVSAKRYEFDSPNYMTDWQRVFVIMMPVHHCRSGGVPAIMTGRR